MSLFHFHTMSFQKIDPQGGGLSEEIHKEQLEPEAIVLEDYSAEELNEYLETIIEDVRQDPDWFSSTHE